MEGRIALFALMLLLQACPKPVGPVRVVLDDVGCPQPPPDVFSQIGVDATFAQSTYGKVIVGTIDIKTQPQVVALLSQAVSDTRMRDYLRCQAIRRQRFTPEQAAYLEQLNSFVGTKPTAEQFIEWQRQNPFPRTSPSSTDEQTLRIVRQLREEFKRVLDTHQFPFAANDFRRVDELLIVIRQLDQDNGHLHYYTGEIKRKLGRKIDSHRDFFRYLEVEQTLTQSEREGTLDAEVCYQRAKGYCRQRTAWICHLLANDFFDAGKRTDNLELKRRYLKDALSYANCVFKKYPSGFSDPSQLIPTSVLQKELNKMLVDCSGRRNRQEKKE